MPITLNTEQCRNLETAINTEWLCTNSLGGYASGTVAGANTRKYHGHLVVALKPPVQRYVILSHVEDRIIIDTAGESAEPTFYDLSTNEFVDVVHPHGYRNLISFELRDGCPVWRYQAGVAILEKSITLIPGEDTVLLRYELLKGKGKFRLQIHPMLAGRDFHGTIQESWRPSWKLMPGNIGVEAPDCPVKLYFAHNADCFTPNPNWWYNFMFRVERQCGYPDREDLWTPGTLEFTLEPNKPAVLIASTKPMDWKQHESLIKHAKEHHTHLTKPFAQHSDEFLSTLAIAADQFIVKRGDNGGGRQSVIAGYPWFEDW
ncbi:MAG: amylo-alpha-1,6-glucosidase, partial [Phycisphaerales bacterium]|nr:amylo-alpha-1,6-glucosidase [Phycisphaerales bacterium]